MTNPVDSGKPAMDRTLAESLRSRGKTTAAGQGQERPAPQQPEASAGNSGPSSRLQAVLDRISQTPEVDQARVDALRQSIAEGNYPIDADRIAERMVELERLLDR